MNYYNDSSPYCCEWLETLIALRLIPLGIVSSRPIQKVHPDEIKLYTQVHLFAGIGGWAYALRLAGWSDDRPIWTGSCPCQPFSNAGLRKGFRDKRHLWPYMHRLIRHIRPPVVMGEQVAAKAGYAWFDRVQSDLAKENYQSRAVDIPACSVDAPHIRNRLYWVADSFSKGLEIGQKPGIERVSVRQQRQTVKPNGSGGEWVEDSSNSERWQSKQKGDYTQWEETGWQEGDSRSTGRGQSLIGLDNPANSRLPETQSQTVETLRHQTRGLQSERRNSSNISRLDYPHTGRRQQNAEEKVRPRGIGAEYAGFWNDYTLIGPDPQGRYRRIKPSLRPLADGVPSRVHKLTALGNSIVPELAAEVIRAYMEAYPE